MILPTDEEIRAYRDQHGIDFVTARRALLKRKAQEAVASAQTVDELKATISKILDHLVWRQS